MCVCLDQWCSQDHNLRDWDIVKTPRLEIWDRDSRVQNLSILPKFCFECRHHFWVELFFNFWHFQTCFDCFLPANKTNKKSLNFRNFTNYFFAIFKVWRPVAFKTETRPETFETETRKNGSRHSITGSNIYVHCIYYREYCFSYCMLGSDRISRFGLGLKTSHFSSLSLEGWGVVLVSITSTFTWGFEYCKNMA